MYRLPIERLFSTYVFETLLTIMLTKFHVIAYNTPEAIDGVPHALFHCSVRLYLFFLSSQRKKTGQKNSTTLFHLFAPMDHIRSGRFDACSYP